MKKIWLLIISVAVAEAAGVIGSFFTVSAINSWYQYLNKPFFSPPNYLFAPVWTMLYALMGMALYLVIRSGFNKPGVKIAFIFYVIQLALNTVWSIIFFGFQSPFWALMDIGALWVLIVVLIPLFYRVSKLSAYLLIPYLLWVSFASALNFSIWQLN